MTIRAATISDLDQLSKLFDPYRVFYRKKSDITSAKNFLTERLNEKDSEIFIAENNKKSLVGFVQLYPLFSSTRMKKLWLLNDLFVDAEYIGQQVSKQLIDRGKKLVRDTSACGMFLETEKTNNIGNNLFPKAGFSLNKNSNYYEWYGLD